MCTIEKQFKSAVKSTSPLDLDEFISKNPGIDIDMPLDEYKSTALHLLIYESFLTLHVNVEKLVGYGASLYAQDSDDMDCFDIALCNERGILKQSSF
jgi:hypothetical protein